MFNLRAFLLEGIQRGLGRGGGEPEGRGVKKRLSKNPFYTVVLQREKLLSPSNLSAEATFLSFERENGEGGKERVARKVGK